MSSTNATNLPKLELSSSGISLPTESDVLDGVIQDFQNAFDGKLKFQKDSNNNLLLSTPQGQLVTSIAAMISDRNRLLAYYVNQVDPNYAVGRMQDGIGRIYFIERKRATKTTVVGRCFGAKSTVIPQYTKVKDQQGNVYESTDSAVINQELTETILDKNGNIVYVDKDGNIVSEDTEGKIPKTKTTTYVDIMFRCLEKGIITCPAGSLTERYQVIVGWESVTNLNDGTVGIADESQAQFEQRRRQSVARNSKNSVDSIMASLLTLDIIEDAYVIENYTADNIDKIDSNPNKLSFELLAHSIYVCVYLRAQTEQSTTTSKETPSEQIAKTIWKNKTPGCALVGNETVQITDDTTDSDGNCLYCDCRAPTYLIKFDYATQTNVYINVIMEDSKPIVGDPATLIKDKIYEVFTGQDGSKKPRIGSQILASQFYCAVQSLGEWAKVIYLKIGLDGVGDKDKIQVAINQMPVLNKDNITVKFENDTTGT